MPTAAAFSRSALGMTINASDPPNSNTVGLISCPQIPATEDPAISEPVRVAALTFSFLKTRSTFELGMIKV